MEIDESAYTAGVEAAKSDLAAGSSIYRWSGHAGHWGHWIVTQYEERFGIGVSEGFGCCLTTAAEQSFNMGYNEILAAEIDRRHGAGAFAAVFDDSRLQTEEALWTAKVAWLKKHDPTMFSLLHDSARTTDDD